MKNLRSDLTALEFDLNRDMDDLRHSYEAGWSSRCCGCGEPFAWNERRVHIMLDPSTDAWACVRCAGEALIEDDIMFEEDGVPWIF